MQEGNRNINRSMRLLSKAQIAEVCLRGVEERQEK